jgi:TrmH family RNA methyltransferase
MLGAAQVKVLASLQQKKYRQKYGEFLIEGNKLLTEAIRSGAKIRRVIVTEGNPLPPYPLPANITPEFANAQSIKRISSLTQPPGVMATVAIPDPAPLFHADRILYLDAIRDPGNMGTLIRSAEWFGFSEVVCSPECVDVYNPKVLQASMGAMFRVKLSVWDGALNDLNKDYRILAADASGTPVREAELPEKAILIIGSESHGLSETVRDACDTLVSIPSSGKGESLNAAVAASILMWEMTSGKS